MAMVLLVGLVVILGASWMGRLVASVAARDAVGSTEPIVLCGKGGPTKREGRKCVRGDSRVLSALGPRKRCG